MCDVQYILDTAKALLAIPGPTGRAYPAADAVEAELKRLGYAPWRTAKGGVLADLGGEGEPLLLEAHADTLGAMVAEVKANGRLRLVPLGGLNAHNTEAENALVITREGRQYEGTFQLVNASLHVNRSYNDTPRNFDTMELVLDEEVFSAGDTDKLGIATGDFVCFDPRTRITPSGYIKSRFLDDKLSVAILLGYAKHLKEQNITPGRKVYIHVTVYEEVGHGGSASVPEGVVEAVSVDMGCVGSGLNCTEREVSICAKDSGGPYDSRVVDGLVRAAKENDIPYAVDIYPAYGSDVEATLRAGYDLRHGLIGPGVYASHGYERSHVRGVKATLDLLKAYIG